MTCLINNVKHAKHKNHLDYVTHIKNVFSFIITWVYTFIKKKRIINCGDPYFVRSVFAKKRSRGLVTPEA